MASYYVWSAAAGAANGTSWANAYTTLTLAYSGKAAGDVFYVAHDHSESTATLITLSTAGTYSAPVKVICANRAGSVPPVSADRRTTASVAATGVGSHISFGGTTHYDGIIFLCSNLTNTGEIRIPGSGFSNAHFRFDNCSLRLNGSNASNKILLGSGGTPAYGSLLELNNTTVSFAATAQGFGIAMPLRWRNTPSALLGTISNALFQQVAGYGGWVECIGVDFSAAGSGKTIVSSLASAVAHKYMFVDCKLDAAVTKSAVPNSIGSTEIDFVRSGSSGVNYQVFRHRMSGTLDHELTVVRSGGATDGVTPISWKVITTANVSYSVPFECPPIAVWNDTTGSARTATIECIWGGGAVPLDSEIWVDVEYLSDASSPQASFVNDGTADLLAAGANQTSSSATWGGSTTKFKLNVTFTPQMKGWCYCRVKVAKASSTFYVDPLCVLS